MRRNGPAGLTHRVVDDVRGRCYIVLACAITRSESHARSVDSVVLALAVQPNPGLADALRERGCDVQMIGDCSGVGYIEGAMLDAARAARTL